MVAGVVIVQLNEVNLVSLATIILLIGTVVDPRAPPSKSEREVEIDVHLLDDGFGLLLARSSSSSSSSSCSTGRCIRVLLSLKCIVLEGLQCKLKCERMYVHAHAIETVE